MASNSSQDTAQEVQNARVGSLSIHLFGLSAQVHRLPPTGVLAVEGLALDQPVDSHAITPATTAWARVFTELARALDDALEPNSMVLGLTSKAQLDIIKVGCSPQEEQIAQEAIKEVATEWVRNAGRLLQVRRTKRSDRPNRRIYPGDTLADAGKMMLYHELVHMCRHQRAARSGEDSEGVHQMRIGSRKVRAAIRSFRAAYVPEVETALLTELKQLGRKLGRVRDADVLGLRLGGYAERVDAVDDPAHAALQALLKRERGPHRGTLVRVLKGVPYADWLAEIGQFVTSDDRSLISRQGDAPVGVRAKRAIGRCLKRVMSRRDTLSPTSPDDELHQLRINCKRLRYTLELFSDLLPNRGSRLIADTKGLQDALGDWRDTDVLRTDLASRASELPESSGFIDRVTELISADHHTATAQFWFLWGRYTTKQHRRWCSKLLKAIEV